MLGSSGTSAPGTFRAYVVCDDPATRGEPVDIRHLPGAPALTSLAIARGRLV
jgi:hypothetical protein